MRAFTATESHNALKYLNRLEAENAVLKEEIEGGTVAATIATARTTTASPAEIIAAPTTTTCNDALVAALKQQNPDQMEMMTKLMVSLVSNIPGL